MKLNKLICVFLLASVLFLAQGCKKFLDVNDDPSNLKEVQISQLLPSVTVNIGYLGASDLFRYSGLMTQQFSGQTTNSSQTFKEYERYNINNSDVNNQWSTIFSTILADIEKIIEASAKNESPHYSGVAKLLKAYVFHITTDAWGDIPYTEAAKFTDQLMPKFDDDAAIYPALLSLIDEGVAEINAPVSAFDPDKSTTIYISNDWASAKNKWLRFANTLKLRLILHYSQKDAAFTAAQLIAVIGSGAQFMQSNADNFLMKFNSTAQQQTPIVSVEGGQFKNSFWPNRTIVDMMNAKADPRRAFYFVPFPYKSNPATYKGASILDNSNSVAYSRLNTFLKGAATINTVTVNPDGSITDNSITWAGDAPSRLLTFAEYNFIRAEAALLYSSPGDAQTFFAQGIQASMTDAGVAQVDITTYLAANGTLSGTNQNKLAQIINEKFIANFGVLMEPWSDWRRTGYPALVPVSKQFAIYDQIPRSLFYPLSETNSNSNITQKSSMLERVFWDTRP